eukprot:TRINITY_DN20223_c0_g1_i1.p1 TRINITY_DN20223_c0_g1~~TRINITY_DN20223_c0_g1_i1.p1  ORF type:complete len:173 (+),score=36.51 TRINITY_DN20223_c0_g1_i1:29-547(+)
MIMDILNDMSIVKFMELFGNIVEHTPKVAELLAQRRPFNSKQQLLDAIDSIVGGNNVNQVEILTRHPDLAGKLSQQGLLTPESSREQMSAGLTNISEKDRKKLTELNDSYRSKFGFTFVICARENKLQSILNGLEKRMTNSRPDEINVGTLEVIKIAKLRALDICNSFNAKM